MSDLSRFSSSQFYPYFSSPSLFKCFPKESIFQVLVFFGILRFFRFQTSLPLSAKVALRGPKPSGTLEAVDWDRLNEHVSLLAAWFRRTNGTAVGMRFGLGFFQCFFFCFFWWILLRISSWIFLGSCFLFVCLFDGFSHAFQFLRPFGLTKRAAL